MQYVTESEVCVCVVCVLQLHAELVSNSRSTGPVSLLFARGRGGGGEVSTGIVFLLVTRANMTSLLELISICNLSPSQMMSPQVSLQKPACICLLSASCRWCHIDVQLWKIAVSLTDVNAVRGYKLRNIVIFRENMTVCRNEPWIKCYNIHMYV